MENLTDICNPETIIATLNNVTLDYSNITGICDNITDVATELISEDDELYWQRILPKLRELYVQDSYGEYYKLVFHASFVVCIIGYITNFFNIVVLSSTTMAHSMNLFLLVLSVADILHITTQFAHILHYMLGFQLFPDYKWIVFYKWNTYFETLFLYLTNWLAVSIGAWRFIAITWPLQTREWCSKGRAKIVICVIIVLSAVLATPIFAIVTSKTMTVRSRVLYEKTFSKFATEHESAFLKAYWVFLLFMGFIPSIILSLLTFGLFRNLYLARAKRRNIADNKKGTVVVGSHKTTVMLTIILIFYILSNFPDGCMYFISLVTNGDEAVEAKSRHFTDVIRIFMLTNSSAAFFIYYGLGEGFRTRFHRAFCCCVYNRLSRQRDISAKTTTSELNRSRTTISSDIYRPSLPNIYTIGPTTVL